MTIDGDAFLIGSFGTHEVFDRAQRDDRVVGLRGRMVDPALEPQIDARTMEIHHGKHHSGYVTKLNAALKGTKWEDKSIEEVLRSLDSLPEKIRTAYLFLLKFKYVETTNCRKEIEIN